MTNWAIPKHNREKEEDEGSAEDEEEEDEETPEEKAADLCEEANKLLEESSEDDEALNQAIQMFEQALVLHPTNVEAFLGKAYVYGLQGDFQKGLNLLEAAKTQVDDPRIEEMIQEAKNMLSEGEKEEETSDKTEEIEDSGPKDTIGNLIENGVMTKRFYEVLVTIFEYYDKDQDGAWNLSELNQFFQKVNGHPADSATLKFLRDNFEKDKHGWITLTGFLNLYLSQTAGDQNETLHDLEKLGFDQHLNPIDQRYSSIKS